MCLEGPAARSSTDVEEDLGLGTLMDDGAGSAVGCSRPEVEAATIQPGNNPVRPEEPPYEIAAASECVSAREPVAESTILTLNPIEIPTHIQ